jgi:hypothetical protein
MQSKLIHTDKLFNWSLDMRKSAEAQGFMKSLAPDHFTLSWIDDTNFFNIDCENQFTSTAGFDRNLGH